MVGAAPVGKALEQRWQAKAPGGWRCPRKSVDLHIGNGRGATERGLWHDRVNPHDHHDQVPRGSFLVYLCCTFLFLGPVEKLLVQQGSWFHQHRSCFKTVSQLVSKLQNRLELWVQRQGRMFNLVKLVNFWSEAHRWISIALFKIERSFSSCSQKHWTLWQSICYLEKNNNFCA